MNGKKIRLTGLLLLSALYAHGEKSYKFRVQLTDKAATTYSLSRPQEFLSARSLERRQRQGIAVDSTDLPVCASYVRVLTGQGGRLISSSKWNNTVLLQTKDRETAERFLENPFVKSVKEVWVSPDSASTPREDRKKKVTNRWKKLEDTYGVGAKQVRLHRGDSLHAAGFRGKGMQVAVIDAGFYNVDVIKHFKTMNLLGTYDFVDPQSDIYAQHNHGMKVLSCMAVSASRVFVGTAPEASYWLLRSEDNDTEQPAEEDNWAAALEFADSVGVDVVNTSLGYYSFDNPIYNYKYRNLDGKTSLMSASASRAADKGMLIVCSAGNSGTDVWKKITPPADAENILTVGAVDSTGVNADFSSVGNTADGRIKPDVMAIGEYASVVGDDGGTAFANGTSFAAPIFCGLATCLWQACPWLTVKELINVIHRSGDRADAPDNIFGYGIPDMWKAYRLGLELKEKSDNE